MSENKPYHDNSILDEFDDDFDTPSTSAIKTVEMKLADGKDKKDTKVEWVTDTRNYTSSKVNTITPEQANAEAEAYFFEEEQKRKEEYNELTKEYADPVIASAVKNIEQRIGRKINYDEFDKLCRTYAAELANRDAENRNDLNGPNKIDYETYYKQAIENRRVMPAHIKHMEAYEDGLITEIDSLVKRHKSYDSSDLHIGAGDPINVRHKGKVFIRDEEKNREIIINNENDVILLRMKYRQEWLDKKCKEEISEIENSNSHDDDGFE